MAPGWIILAAEHHTCHWHSKHLGANPAICKGFLPEAFEAMFDNLLCRLRLSPFLQLSIPVCVAKHVPWRVSWPLPPWYSA